MSPGFVPDTNLSSGQGFLARTFMKYVMPFAPFATRKVDAAKALVDLALNQEVGTGNYVTKGQVKESSSFSRDKGMQDQLWKISCETLEISEIEKDFGSSASA